MTYFITAFSFGFDINLGFTKLIIRASGINMRITPK
jgi:hypothetical protein